MDTGPRGLVVRGTRSWNQASLAIAGLRTEPSCCAAGEELWASSPAASPARTKIQRRAGRTVRQCAVALRLTHRIPAQMFELEADAVLFDSDGVLVDSHRVVEMAWRRLAAEFDLDVDRLLSEHAGVRPADTLRPHLTGERAAHAVARLEELELDLVGGVEAMPGAQRLTARLSSFPCAFVTSGTRRLATARWKEAGIEIPHVTVTAEDTARGKPDPAPYLTAAHLLGIEPGRCVVFEDSPSGGAAARAFGGTVVAVGGQSWPFEPAVRVDSLAQVDFRNSEGTGRSASLIIHTNP